MFKQLSAWAIAAVAAVSLFGQSVMAQVTLPTSGVDVGGTVDALGAQVGTDLGTVLGWAAVLIGIGIAVIALKKYLKPR
jgi:hypothetical protein